MLGLNYDIELKSLLLAYDCEKTQENVIVLMVYGKLLDF